MTLHFITGNEHKLREAQAILSNIDNVKLDLPEIQSLDSQEIIAEKLKEATKKHDGEFFIEDVSLYIEYLNGFPGPLIKWLLKSLKAEGIANLVKKYENSKATVKAVVGYSDGTDIHFFTGEVQGKIVQSRGTFNLEGKDIEMLPGVIIFMKSNAVHSLKADENTSFILVLNS